MKSVVFPSGLTAIGADAFGESGLKRVEFPASLRTVGVGAFSWCALERIAFSEGLETLGAQAFYNCLSLETVELPASLTNIGGEAFEIDFDVDPNPKRDLRLIASDGSFAAKYAEENRMKRVAPEK
ncbi:MAG: leucine-rich repeat domain-containing protein [Thermoguttaceae bacterium]|nr:leucine-rich repeat domain-containing protein [Thermoguttaceae bacterium]